MGRFDGGVMSVSFDLFRFYGVLGQGGGAARGMICSFQVRMNGLGEWAQSFEDADMDEHQLSGEVKIHKAMTRVGMAVVSLK